MLLSFFWQAFKNFVIIRAELNSQFFKSNLIEQFLFKRANSTGKLCDASGPLFVLSVRIIKCMLMLLTSTTRALESDLKLL